MTDVLGIGTPHGPARAHVTQPPGAVRGTLVLGHGAGGGIGSPDLVAVTEEASGAGWRAVRVEQPWRVAGRRVAVAPPKLDEGWAAVVDLLRADAVLAGPVVFGGRSAGARVACRTASALGAAGVLALAFPLHPPGRPGKTRAPELTGVTVPLCVVQGETDAFGSPADVAAVLTGYTNASLYGVPGDHSLKKNVDVVAAASLAWLDELA